MKKINQLLTLISTVFLISNLLSVCSANPEVPAGTFSSEPNPPLFNVELPKENQTFEEGSIIWLNFSVSGPVTKWTFPGGRSSALETFGEIKLIKYSLDGKSYDITGKEQSGEQSAKDSILYYSIPCEYLSAGWHRIVISAE